MDTITKLTPLYLRDKRKLVLKSRQTYTFALRLFAARLQDKPVQELTHQDLSKFIYGLERASYARGTINLAVTAVTGFFKWAAFQRYWTGDLSDIQYVASEGKSSLVAAAPEYDRAIVAGLVSWAATGNHKDIISQRDAFLVLAASSSGARLGKELCELKRGQVDWDKGRAIVIGKGNKEGKLLFSDIAIEAGRRYLQARAAMDGRSGQALTSLPLFARHHNNTTKPLGYSGAYKSLKKRIAVLFGNERCADFHPHVMRHEFVTQILVETGNLKLAQDLARHTSISTTQRYAHLADEDVDRAHKDIFNR